MQAMEFAMWGAVGAAAFDISEISGFLRRLRTNDERFRPHSFIREAGYFLFALAKVVEYAVVALAVRALGVHGDIASAFGAFFTGVTGGAVFSLFIANLVNLPVELTERASSASKRPSTREREDDATSID